MLPEYPASCLRVFGNLYGREGVDDGGLPFAEDTSLPGLSAQQWQLRVTAQGTAPGEIDNSKLRRLPMRNNSFNCAGTKVGNSALPHKAANRGSAPKRRGLFVILYSGDAGATVQLRTQTSRAARYCVRGEVDTKEAGEVDRNPAPGSLDALDGMPAAAPGKTPGDDRLI